VGLVKLAFGQPAQSGTDREEGRMDINLILFKKDGSQKAFPLPNSATIIGRRHDCDLRIPLMSVSRRHCQINCNKDTLKIRDLGSHNGTYLNGKRINDETTLRAGDYLKIGPLTFLLQIDGHPKEIVPPAADRDVRQPEPAKSASSGPKAEKKKEPATAEATAEEDSIFDLETDESDKDDSFLDELNDL
jgi:pSer/pThr/pTyr-binding forkhead associated (FHA) protein